MKLTFITTVLNENHSIGGLLSSLIKQTRFPDEIIIVDGGSNDKTVKIVKSYEDKLSKTGINLKIFVKKGNRSVGRNQAIKAASGDILVCSDSGCVLDKNWIAEITEPFKEKDTDVVAGYYEGVSNNVFQKCVIPYALVMPNQIDPANFLPATRSMAFRKTVWKKIGGFDEKLSHNEDYDFARKIKKQSFKIAFARNAVVYWSPPNNIKKAFIMFFRFAYGDAEAEIYRPKAILIILRYLIGLILIKAALLLNSTFLFIFVYVLIINYLLWAILKNYWYVKKLEALVILPILQFTSDLAVIFGTALGSLKRIGK